MYLKGIRSGLEIVAPGLSSFYDGQHFFIMNRIVSFRGGLWNVTCMRWV